MPYNPMSAAELHAFLTSPVRPAILATTGAGGAPHAAPIWYDLDDGDIVFNTGAATVKGKNLARDPRAAITVQDDRAPYSFALLRGIVSLSDDLDDVRRWAARIGGRYMGADRADEYGQRNGVPGELVCRLRIERVVTAAAVAD